METINYFKHNITFLKWYLNKNEMSSDQINKLYNTFMLAYDENKDVFMRIVGYMAGTRNTFRNFHYRLVLHFLATNYPDRLMANLDLLLTYGQVNDVLYLLREPTVSDRVRKYIKYNRFKKDFSDLDEDVLSMEYNLEPYFKYRLKKDDYMQLLDKILTDKEMSAMY